jgi:hypothetical protein
VLIWWCWWRAGGGAAAVNASKMLLLVMLVVLLLVLVLVLLAKATYAFSFCALIYGHRSSCKGAGQLDAEAAPGAFEVFHTAVS